jgi:hypothetical protein
MNCQSPTKQPHSFAEQFIMRSFVVNKTRPIVGQIVRGPGFTPLRCEAAWNKCSDALLVTIGSRFRTETPDATRPSRSLPKNPGASLTRVPDRAAIGAEGSPPVNLRPANAHTHARFRTKRQSFLRFQAASANAYLGVTNATLVASERGGQEFDPFGGQSLQSEP